MPQLLFSAWATSRMAAASPAVKASRSLSIFPGVLARNSAASWRMKPGLPNASCARRNSATTAGSRTSSLGTALSYSLPAVASSAAAWPAATWAADVTDPGVNIVAS